MKAIPFATFLALLVTALAGCEPRSAGAGEETPKIPKGEPVEKATFAGGCFWCMEPPLEKLEGVYDVVSGYAGGSGDDPTYDDYARKGHVEAVQITYNPEEISYGRLLKVFWRQIDPTDAGGQFNDRGRGYSTAIFYHDEEQKRLAEESKKGLEESERFDEPIATKIRPASTFYRAEDYHQDYAETHSIRYKLYRAASGRDRFLDRAWGEDREVSGAGISEN